MKTFKELLELKKYTVKGENGPTAHDFVELDVKAKNEADAKLVFMKSVTKKWGKSSASRISGLHVKQS